MLKQAAEPVVVRLHRHSGSRLTIPTGHLIPGQQEPDGLLPSDYDGCSSGTMLEPPIYESKTTISLTIPSLL